MAEGFIKNTVVGGVNTFSYIYNYTDHLGNVRVSYEKDATTGLAKIVDDKNYYPFGLQHKGYNNIVSTKKSPFQFNGKQALGFGYENMIDYGWRNYMPDIGRWSQMDPLLNDLNFAFDDSKVDKDDDDEVYQALITKLDTGGGIYNPDNLNPYGYGYNNPVSFDDPDGRCPICAVVVIASLLLASEPALAPTRDKAGDGRRFGEAKADKVDFMSNAVPLGGAKTATSVVLAVVKKEVKDKVKEQVVKTLNQAEARAEKLSEKARPGQPFTKAGKEAVKDLNVVKNGGKPVCETCGTNTVPATQGKKGVTPAKNETNIDHVEAKSKGGSGTPNNGQVLCRDCNIKKSNN
jgi:RHS repeat-associated protein